ncbi:hypothetical protein, partial [Streptomyces scabiei]|uniref:hypothetical protein n=1 Tax=Streptomyces scabiei TaxID=1930 RepID=UPI0038F618C7
TNMVTISRAQISIPRFDDCGYVDVTIKSSTGTAKLFAPTWDMVMGHKNGSLSDLDYITQYLQILDSIEKDTWEWLACQAINNQLVVMCYCFS